MNNNISENSLFAGLDIGTSGARAVVIDNSGNEIASGRSNIPDHGKERRNPEAWWQAASEALDQLCSAIDPSTIVAIAVDATSGTVLPIDFSGAPVASAMMYNDPVTDTDILQTIAAVAPASSAVHGASSALARAISLQKTPGNARIAHQADWIAGQLSGCFDLSDESNALKTGYDPITRQWPDWIEQTGMQVEKLPEVLPAGTRSGIVTAVTAARFGFSEDLVIVTGVTDGCASFLATGANEVGDCVTALGSSLTMKMLCDTPLFAPEYGIYSHRIGEQWLAGGASNTGGAVLEYYFDQSEISTLSEEIDPHNQPSLGYYPLLQPGERFPHNDASWPAVLEPRPASDSEFLHALFEGMASIEALGYQRLTELGCPRVKSVRSVGGGAGNPQWTTIRRLHIDAPFVTPVSTEAATGVARLALAAMSD